MYFFGSGYHISFSISKLDQLEQVLGVTVDMFGVTWTVPSWYRPLCLPAQCPTELFLTEFQSFYVRIKKVGSSWRGVPGSDNVCSRSLICKVNPPRLNYWHLSTGGGLNYDALNQTGVHCNYSHFTQLKSPLCKISIPQTSQITPTNSTPPYHDRMMNMNCE